MKSLREGGMNIVWGSPNGREETGFATEGGRILYNRLAPQAPRTTDGGRSEEISARRVNRANGRDGRVWKRPGKVCRRNPWTAEDLKSAGMTG